MRSAVVAGKRFFVLRYDYVSDVAAKRPALRPAHLELVGGYVASGELLLGGALEPMEKGGVLVFHTTRERMEAFVRSDPYVVAPVPIVSKHTIDPWNVVAGSLKDKV
jgi:uncharacterized protein YciI